MTKKEKKIQLEQTRIENLKAETMKTLDSMIRKEFYKNPDSMVYEIEGIDDIYMTYSNMFNEGEGDPSLERIIQKISRSMQE